jgi:hypothetical protein
VVGQVDSPITFSGPTVVEADGLTVDTIIGHTTLLPGTLVTITSSMGTLLTDASQEHTGFQAVVSGQGLFFIDIRRPLAAGIPTLTAQAIDAPGEGTASDPNVLAYVLAGLRRFDFNETLANVTAAGFSPVLGYDTYSPERGYGWAQPVQEFDRGDGNYSVATVDLYRDGHSASTGTQRTFRIQVQSGVTYDVRVYVGDQSVALDQVQIATEVGTVIAAPDTPAGAFTSVLFTGLFDVNDDGVLDMTISDQGGLATGWAINGLDIADAMVGLPPTALLLIDGGALSLAAGEELASSGSGDLLTLDGLAPLVAEAIARWRGAGIDDVQLALLQSVTFEIADLDSQGFLGLAGSRRIVLDDNAAGYGWFIDPTAWDDDEFEFIASSQRQALDGPAADNIDLLTVILHELGHVLGLGDLHPSVSEHDLMTDRFSPGLRRTPDRASLDALFEQLGNED